LGNRLRWYNQQAAKEGWLRMSLRIVKRQLEMDIGDN